VIQPFLSSRTSSTTDLINNTLGTALGALGYALTRARRSFR
jgi:glycopeptide antibiotics resistance protein